jgi:hypothetical protein
MLDMPTYIFPFFLSLIAFVGGRLLLAHADEEAGSLPGWVLHAAAIACVLVGLVSVWLEIRY